MQRVIPSYLGRWSTISLLTLALSATSLVAQRTLTSRQAGKPIANESFALAADTMSADTQIPPLGVHIRSRLELSKGSPRAFHTEVTARDGAPREAHVAVGGDSIRIELVAGSSTVTSRSIAIERGTPVIVFQNFVWSILEPTLAPYAQGQVAEPKAVTVYLVDMAKVESWTVTKTDKGIALTTPVGLRIECTFVGGHLTAVAIPAQSIDVS